MFCVVLSSLVSLLNCGLFPICFVCKIKNMIEAFRKKQRFYHSETMPVILKIHTRVTSFFLVVVVMATFTHGQCKFYNPVL